MLDTTTAMRGLTNQDQSLSTRSRVHGGPAWRVHSFEPSVVQRPQTSSESANAFPQTLNIPKL